MPFTTQSLNGTWNLEQSERKLSLPAAVPGDVHTALFENEIIPDPTIGNRGTDMLWIGESDWLYTLTFEAAESLLSQPHVFLNFEKIDTHASVKLNGALLGESDNAFKVYRFDCTQYLRGGNNTLSVYIRSGHKVGLEKGAQLPYPLMQGRTRDSAQINLQRKPQFQGGWDWCHSLLMHGIPGDVTLIGTDNFLLSKFVTEQEHTANACSVTLTATVEILTACEASLDFTFDGQTVAVTRALPVGTHTLSHTFTVAEPELWWPAGYGNQALYSASVTAGDQQIDKQIGLRTLAVIREQDSVGESFGIRVNGVDIFCSGANWIPCDDHYSQMTHERYSRLIEDFHKAGMNMLRVWGGGQYEPAEFYESCDRLGILIWQDLMFACMPYPSDADFLQNIDEEVRYQVSRLRDHPSIALWCGGNELLGSFTMQKQMEEAPGLYMVNYERFASTTARAVRETDPTRTFWPTSPCRGEMDFTGDWTDDTRGNTHFWEVGTGFSGAAQPFTQYQSIQPRFCSEFGMLGMSSLDTIKDFCPPEECVLNSETLRYHAQRTETDRGVINMMFEFYRIYPDFEYIVYLSQLQQAMGVKYAVEFWRSTRTLPDESIAPARCRGALYWQFNDVWPTSSAWASIDHHGRWKQLHYQAQRFSKRALIGSYIHEESGNCVVFLSNETGAPLKGAAHVEIVDFSGRALSETRFQVNLPNASVEILKDVPLVEITEAPRETCMLLRFFPDGETTAASENYALFVRPFELPIYTPKITTTLVENSEVVTIELSTDKAALYVMVESPYHPGHFSDGAFFLIPNRPKTLTWTPANGKTPADARAFANTLRITCLR